MTENLIEDDGFVTVHPAPTAATPAAALDLPPEAQVRSACLSYRHDFGLLDEQEQERVMFQARQWLHAWHKELPAALPAVTVGVKPLVWTDPQPPGPNCRYDHVTAQSALGEYRIEWKSWKDHDYFSIFCAEDFVDACPTLEAAKAAAQADYEARVLAALEPVTPAPDACTFPACRCHYEAGNPRCETAQDAAAIREAALRVLASFIAGMDAETFLDFARDMDEALQTHKATEAADRIHALITENKNDRA